MTHPSVRSRPAATRSALALGAVAIAGATLLPATSASAAPVTIDVIAITDYHGRLETSNAVGGAAVLAGAVDSFRADNPNTVFVSSGDNIGASTFTSFIQDDEPTLDVLTDMDLFASAIGNHELDRGREDLDGRVIPYLAADGNPFPYLAANLYDTTTDAPAYDEYAIADFGGISIGFIGAVTEDLPSLVSPAGIETLDVRPIVPEVARVADQLSDGVDSNGEADITIALIHEGASSESDPAAAGTPFGDIVAGLAGEVDAISGGHTHVEVATAAGVLGRNGLPLAIVQAGQYSEVIGHLSIVADDATGTLTSITAEVLPLRTATEVDGETVWVDNYPADAEVQAKVDAAVELAAELGAAPVGTITGDLNRARQSNGDENRGGESTLGNFVAEVQRWATDTEIAFMNPGGLREDLAFAAGEGETNGEGVVTYQEAAEVQPFANTLVTMDLTGAQIRQALEQQWQPADASRPFLKLGVSEGFEYTYDPSAPAGSRILDMFLDGAPISDTATHRVTVNSFLASGGDNFGVFAEGGARADSGRVDLETQVAYFDTFGTVTPPTDQRAVGVVLSSSTVEQGGTVTLDLSSLLFSAGEDNPETVEVLLGGELIGSSDIDPAIVDTTDEVGRATVDAVIPEDATAGTAALTIRTDAGTAVDVFVTIEESDELAATGIDAGPAALLALLALLALAAGGGLTLVRRRA